MADLSVERVVEAMRNGDTAQSLATRLGEPGGVRAIHSPRRVVAALTEARRLGRVESRCDFGTGRRSPFAGDTSAASATKTFRRRPNNPERSFA